MPHQIVIGDLTFVCDDAYEVARAQTLYTKEPGTIAWLRATLGPGDVFYDIGANIGCYSLVTARLVGETGHVYAFEPHLMNAMSLLRNIQANDDVTQLITVVTTPLDNRSALRPFHYASLRAGSSGHQLGSPIGERGVFQPVVSVLAQSMRLSEARGLHAPDVVKIDVDGHELSILQGMVFGATVRSLQVEVHPADRTAIIEHMAGAGLGYHLASRHYTQNGQKAVDAGAEPDRVTDNAIFTRVAA